MSDSRCESKFKGSRCAKFSGHEGEHHDPGSGQRWRSMRDIEPPTVPLAEHQRVQAERDNAVAAATAYLQHVHRTHSTDESPITCAHPACRDAPLLLPLARTLLEEMEGLRRKVRSLENDVDALNRTCCERNEDLKKADTESADLRARLERAEGRRFPIQGGPSIPWAMIAPHERQAKDNHDQSLQRLAERGGLSPREAVLVLESRPLREWRQMSEAEGLARLTALLSAWEAAQRQPPPGWVPAAEVRRAVEEERASIATLLRARASEWGADTAVGHALEVAASAIRARGKKPEK